MLFQLCSNCDGNGMLSQFGILTKCSQCRPRYVHEIAAWECLGCGRWLVCQPAATGEELTCERCNGTELRKRGLTDCVEEIQRLRFRAEVNAN